MEIHTYDKDIVYLDGGKEQMKKKLLFVTISALICCSSTEAWGLSVNNTEENVFSDGSTIQDDINLFEDDIEVESHEEMESVFEDFLEGNGETTDFITDEENSEIEEISSGENEILLSDDWADYEKNELELNKYYSAIDLVSSWGYILKLNIPKEGRIRIYFEDIKAGVFSGNSSCYIQYVNGWYQDREWKSIGIDTVDSGWITVKAGICTPKFHTSRSFNKEARIIVQYQSIDEYYGEIEDNDTFDTATLIQPGNTYEGNYSKDNDVDFYKFRMSEPGLVKVNVSDKWANTYFWMYEEDENENVYKIGDSFQNTAYLRLGSGNYYIKESPSRFEEEIEYNLDFDIKYESADAYEHEPNNVRSQANVKASNVWYTGNINTSGDIDWFKYDIQKKSYLALELKVPRQLNAGAVKISLYDKDANLLESISSTSNPYIKTDDKLYDKGTYYVRIEGSPFEDDYSFCLNQKEYVNTLPAVTGMTTSVIGMNKVKLNWKAVSGSEGYFIIGMNKDRKGGQIAFTTNTSWMDTAADADAFNFYWVQPYNRDETGKIVKGKLGNYVYALGRNVGNTGKVTATVVNNGVKLSWNKVSGANSYVILSKTGSNKAAFNTPMYTNKTSFIDTTAPSGKVTYYWVYGVYKNASGTVLAAGNISPFAWAKPIGIEGTYVNGTVTLDVYKLGGRYYVDAYGRGGKMNTTVQLYQNGSMYKALYSDGTTFFSVSNVTDFGIKVKFPLIHEFDGNYKRQ